MKNKNPIYKIIDSGQPFTYFHTLLFNEQILRLAVRAQKSLEIDISADHQGHLFVGHPYEFYEYKQMLPPPRNLPIETIVEESQFANLYLVLDCKDVRALPFVTQTIHSYGQSQALFHSWIKEFHFGPLPEEIVVEPHWGYEELPLHSVLDVKTATGVPVISSTRGLTTKRLREEPAIVDHIINVAAGKVDAINFNLPNAEAPPYYIMKRLLDHGLLTWLNVDKVPSHRLPPVYIGISDHMPYVTNPAIFERTGVLSR